MAVKTTAIILTFQVRPSIEVDRPVPPQVRPEAFLVARPALAVGQRQEVEVIGLNLSDFDQFVQVDFLSHL